MGAHLKFVFAYFPNNNCLSNVQKIPLAKYKTGEITDLLKNLGFYKKNFRHSEVPEEYVNGPYIPVKEKEATAASEEL